MEKLLMKQEDTLEQLKKAFINYKKTSKDRLKASYIESKLENLNRLFEAFINIHGDIVGSIKREEKAKLPYFTEDMYTVFEDIYTEYKARIKDDLRLFSANAFSPQAHGPEGLVLSNTKVKLPQIQLPKFSGLYEEWQTFHDMFTSLIHQNTALSPVQKMHYLKSSLTGEPEILLRNLTTTDSNYEDAYEQLIRRYNNKRYNCNEIMKRLLSQRNATDSASSIKSLLDVTSSSLKSLQNMGIDTTSWDVIVNYIVVSRLDSESRKLWEAKVSELDSDTLPTWNQLVNFLESRFRTFEMISGNNKSVVKSPTMHYNNTKPKVFHSTAQEDNKRANPTCTICKGQHLLYQCKQFAKQTPKERTEIIQSRRLCFNCFAPTHSVKECRSSTCCRRCGRRHHTLLHLERSELPSLAEAQSINKDNIEKETPVVAHLVTKKNQKEMLLATAIVRASSANGYSQVVRVLIDPCSEGSFINEATTQSLGLKRTNINGLVSGIGDKLARSRNMVSLSLESIHNQKSKHTINVDAYVLRKLTSFLPTCQTKITDWPEIKSLSLADPEYGSPAKIDMILGVEVYEDIILKGLLKHPTEKGPIAQETQFGWVLSDRVRTNLISTNPQLVGFHIRVKEDDLLKKFWEIEREPDAISKKFTKEELKCEQFFEATTTRDNEGRYVVQLPFKEHKPRCVEGKTRDIALRRFYYLERKLQNNPPLYEEYKRVINGYKDQNHMVRIQKIDDIHNTKAVYLPHHPVVREDKETTRVRIVFDASCKGINRVSLNDCFLVGPKLQQDLRHILMRWRRHPFCILADLVQMYRQVRVDEKDTDFQRILWRSNPNDPIEHYKLLRLTFGTACAPYLAVKALQQLAKDEEAQYPRAAKIALQDYYIDDLLTGCETEMEAVEIFEEMNNLMSAGGFCLQKWCSNSERLMNHIQEECKKLDQPLIFKINNMIKVLGISWNKNSDSFEYTLQLPNLCESITKRKVLSEIARLYDPMGWISPVIITAKIFIQKLWKAKLEWDEKLPAELHKEWCSFRQDLHNVRNIVIPRWLQSHKGDKIELHTFADASQAAYAGAVYMKVTDGFGNIRVNLVTSKTKVSPVEKEISIPRLELCAALLATKLIHEVSQIMQIPKEDLYAWSDSTVVLAWVRGEPTRWNTFVSNRVSEIHTMLDSSQFRHIETINNPADCASRGIKGADLAGLMLWWHGPNCLHHNSTYVLRDDFSTTIEERPIKTLTAIIQSEEELVWTRFSNLTRMVRILAYCKRYIDILKLSKKNRVILSKERRIKEFEMITVKEMEEVLRTIIRNTQNIYYAEEIQQIRSHGEVKRKSSLHTLYPMLDKNKVLRVGGRIKESEARFDVKHPVILPSNSHLTSLLITDAHYKTMHGGPQIMLNYLRSKYWIVRARERVKKCYRECVKCLRFSQQNNNQLMGQLPKCRLKPSRPFKSSGVDFTGFINIRFSPGRGSKSYKGYICLFICMSTKAIHLEAVSDLSSKGFISAFRRFVSRRGQCVDLYSDNGTNFIGAERELRDMFLNAQSKLPIEIAQVLANDGTSWHFIPPNAPNFGGLWEAGIKSAKTHLKRVIGDSTLTFEELSTILTQIEACLNSRPMSYLSEDPGDPQPLTPGHFLIGEQMVAIPDEASTDVHVTGLQRWKMTQKMINDFWKKWSEE
ncbi:uncharacterized protein LOC113394292 [Vanessa tameamea]|uniref:Uncharacterized protein LOC113394292 n=1 Tax=Vanessa tameamea TaxID=334116 RepID=A0ABM4AT25_VANTA